MVAIPPAIIFVNDDLSPSAKEVIIRQLFINTVLDGYTFDSYIAADPSYPAKIKQLNQRVMVIRTFADRFDVTTWGIPDVVVFVKQGLASIEVNKGAPGFTVPVLKLNWGYLTQIGFPFQRNECCCHHSCSCPNRQFLYGHRFDGTTHTYVHETYFKSKG